MSAPTASAADRLSRRPGLPARPGRSRRAELAAAIGVAAVVTQLLFAQGTLILAVCAVLTGRISRWRPLWLAVPAAAGAGWAAAIGPGRAGAGFAAGPRQVAAYLAGTPGHPARLLHLAVAFTGAPHWLPRQLPLALIAAAAQAALLSWLGWPAGSPGMRPGGVDGRPGGRRDGQPAGPPEASDRTRPGYRPGLIHAILRRRTQAALSAGSVVTSDGCRLGLDSASGRPAELSWADATGGVLVSGADPLAAARAGFPLACAAIRRRKSVIVIDLTGSAGIAGALTAAAGAAGAPLSHFSSAGPACYEPFRSHPPSRAARLVTQMMDWTGLSDQQRQAGQRYLADACAVLATGPSTTGPSTTGPSTTGPPGPGQAGAARAGAVRPAATVLEGLITLLEPAALRGAMSGVPGHLPHRDALARRVAESAAALAAEPAAGAALRGQLHRLGASAPGRWLRPSAPTPSFSAAISIGQVVRDRGGAVFSLDCGAHGEAAAMVGRLAVADLAAVLSDLRDQQLRADCFAWIHGCERANRQSLADLAALGPSTGTALLLSTASSAAAASLAAAARVLVTAGPAQPAFATRLAELAEFRDDGRQQAVADRLRWQEEDEFTVLSRGPQRRFQSACRSVPAKWAPRQ
jgi:hypothetical protein